MLKGILVHLDYMQGGGVIICVEANKLFEHTCCKGILFKFRSYMKRSQVTMTPFRNVLSLLVSADLFSFDRGIMEW